MYTLVVVDMQPGFKSARGKRVRANCLREVQKARADRAPIIFLELSGYQPTHCDLVEVAHSNFAILEKSGDDGSEQVGREVRKNKWPKKFKVCGINTDCCVKATVTGLTARFRMSKIEVVADACASDWYHNAGLNEMKKLDNVNVINL